MDKFIKNYTLQGISLFMFPVSNQDRQGKTINPEFTADFLEQAYQAERWQEVDAQIDTLLAVTDYTQVADANITDDSKAAFAAWRKKLRALKDSGGDPDAVVIPEKPKLVKSTTA